MAAQFINIALGLWLMAAPAVLDYSDPAATSGHIVGPLIASIAVVALWAATRSLGRVNVVLGLWLIVAPVLGYPLPALVNSIAVGVAVVATSILAPDAPGQFGGGWTALWKCAHEEPVRRSD